MIEDRERWLAQTLIDLADTLSDDFDLVEMLDRLVCRAIELLGASDAGVLLVDDAGRLQVIASSDERAHLLELFEVQSEDGPCLDAYTTGTAVRNAVLDDERWPRFAPRARGLGLSLVHGLPLRHGVTRIGGFNIFQTDPAAAADEDLDIAQALADMAAISILQDRAMSRAVTVADQLQQALRSRVVIEQAKGVVAEGLHVEIAEAFELLRRRARNRNELLADVARRILDGELTAAQLVEEARPRRRRSDR